LFKFYELPNFHVGGVQGFQLLNVAGPHPRLVERAIIRERMFVASARPEEDYKPEKHELRPHDFIVAGITWKAGKCAVRDTRTEGQGTENERIARKKKEILSGGAFCAVQIAVEKNKLSASATLAK